MFLLLHNYDEIIQTMRVNEMGILLKETGELKSLPFPPKKGR